MKKLKWRYFVFSKEDLRVFTSKDRKVAGMRIFGKSISGLRNFAENLSSGKIVGVKGGDFAVCCKAETEQEARKIKLQWDFAVKIMETGCNVTNEDIIQFMTENMNKDQLIKKAES